MASFMGTARTNYVKVLDADAFRAMAERHGLDVMEQGGEYALSAATDDGFWPSWVSIVDASGEEQDCEFSITEQIMPFVVEGEVLIAMATGAEGLRYVAGTAEALVRRGDEVQALTIHLSDIYAKAAEAIGVDVSSVCEAEY